MYGYPGLSLATHSSISSEKDDDVPRSYSHLSIHPCGIPWRFAIGSCIPRFALSQTRRLLISIAAAKKLLLLFFPTTQLQGCPHRRAATDVALCI